VEGLENKVVRGGDKEQNLLIATLLCCRLMIALRFLLKWAAIKPVWIFGLLVQGVTPRLDFRDMVSFRLEITVILTTVAASSV
jgi:hypothetical protein